MTHQVWKTAEYGYGSFKAIPERIVGIYVFRCRPTKTFIYVGKAKNQPLKRRLLSHWDKSHSEKLTLWLNAFGKDIDVCYRETDVTKIDRLEKLLIRKWKPEANKEHNPNHINKRRTNYV